MEKENEKRKYGSNFEAPRVPYVWLATTFIAPTFVFAVPAFLDASASMQTLVIIALAIFSVLLFVMWLMTHFQLYNEAFQRQLIVAEVEDIKQNHNEIIKESKKSFEVNEKLYAENKKLREELEQRVIDIESENKLLLERLDNYTKSKDKPVTPQ